MVPSFHIYREFLLLILLISPPMAADTAAKAVGETSQPFQLCGSAPRVNCVVDGDTFWFEGEKIRIADIDTPETFQPRCTRERQRGKQATKAFIKLLNHGPFTLIKHGPNRDRYGRSLRVVIRSGKSLGQQLIDKKLAVAWSGKRGNWCP